MRAARASGPRTVEARAVVLQGACHRFAPVPASESVLVARNDRPHQTRHARIAATAAANLSGHVRRLAGVQFA